MLSTNFLLVPIKVKITVPQRLKKPLESKGYLVKTKT